MILFFFFSNNVCNLKKTTFFIQDEITGIHMLLHWSTNMNAMKGTFINILNIFIFIGAVSEVFDRTSYLHPLSHCW